MTESQKRREELLRTTRNLYQSGNVPAVHPRYRAVYHELYQDEGEDDTRGTLGIRILISLILFAVFASADTHDEKLWRYTPSQIVTEIQRQEIEFSIDSSYNDIT